MQGDKPVSQSVGQLFCFTLSMLKKKFLLIVYI